MIRRLYPARSSRFTRLSRYRYVSAGWAAYHNRRLLRRLLVDVRAVESPAAPRERSRG